MKDPVKEYAEKLVGQEIRKRVDGIMISSMRAIGELCEEKVMTDLEMEVLCDHLDGIGMSLWADKIGGLRVFMRRLRDAQ